MRVQTVLAVCGSLFTLAHSAALEPRATAVPGLCTIGIDNRNEDIPGARGVNTPINNIEAWIVGTDGVQTNEPVYSNGDGTIGVHADGNYGGLSGGVWHVESYAAETLKLEWAVISFTGRNDNADQTLDSRQEPSNVCDCYSHGVLAVTTGCRCRFACR